VKENYDMESQKKECKPRMVGINHVALEVGDVDAALDFYGSILQFSLRGRSRERAFIDLGDQFIALFEGRSQKQDTIRHFGLVVDDKEAVRKTLDRLGIETMPTRFLDFLDPWGNHVQIVDYRDISFSKSDQALQEMGLTGLGKR
jgi:lactoylglutathione lyase